ncbi:hypothetical protein I4U23_005547 [Adineta vaga]|nr:hypothetical protein I4U23_005547 [Adineta vaga]
MGGIQSEVKIKASTIGRYPSLFEFELSSVQKQIRIKTTGEIYPIHSNDPLKYAAFLIQDDIALMIEGDDGQYYLKAGTIPLAGFWRLENKFHMSLTEIHTLGNVPKFREKLQLSMERFFQKMVSENNYSIQTDGELAWSIHTYFLPVIDIAQEPGIPGRLASALRTFYYSIESRENTIVIKSPSFVKYSSLTKEVSLQCPCTTLAVKYKQFVAIEPVYHELCQSDFIAERFLQQLLALYKKTWNNSIQTDFHRIAIFQFKTLGIFCQLVQETIKHAVETFLQTDFIQSHLLAQDFFQNHIELLLRDFVELTPKTFLRTLTFTQDITAQNLFMTGASITSVLSFSRRNPTFNDFGNLPFHGINYIFSDNSSCQCTSSTANTCMGLATFKNDSVRGFYTGCYMVSALLKSTLEILYNQTMIDSLTNSSNIFQKLNSSASNSTIKTLLTRMFIIHWSNKTSFEQYFNNCASTSCQYTIIQGNSFLLIVTLLIGLYGGLSSVLTIICPIIIKTIWPFIRKLIVRRRKTIATQNTNNGISRETSVNDRIKQFFQVLKQKLIELNLFKSIPPTDDINILQQQYITTRLYLICVLLAVIILTVFTSMRLPKIRVTIRSPSLEDFIYLYDQYQLSLNCPCNQISIENRLISNIMPHYHEVCSSKFVTSAWINIQFVQNSSKLLYTHDIRYHSQFYFQLLSTLCRIANQTVYDSLESFYQTKFISNQALNSQTFETRINILVEQFKKTVPESFERSLNLLTTNFEINQFVSSMNSIVAKYDLTVNGTYIPQLEMYIYYWYKKSKCNPNELVGLHDCLCIPMGFDECRREIVISEGETTHVIPGMFQGWFPLQSLLMSTLECFYNQTCFLQITEFINSTVSSTNFSILKEPSFLSTNGKYQQIGSLANNLFIQSWKNNSSFQSYFNQCQPVECSYTYTSRSSLISMITTTISLIGGFNTALRLFLPFIVQLVTKIWKYFQQRRSNIIIEQETNYSRIRFCDYFRNLVASGKRKIVQLNLFPTIPRSNDPKIIRRSQRTTRVYLILLLSSLFILILYTLLRQETFIEIIQNPSVSKYRELFSQYSFKLQCPCSRIAIKHNQFISQLKPQYHPICHSIFVSPRWLESLIGPSFYGLLRMSYGDDYRALIHVQFQTIAKLCKLSKIMLNISMSRFEQTDFMTANLISNDEFNLQIELLIEQFKQTTFNQFMETFKLIQLINHGNQLATVLKSNWNFIFERSSDHNETPSLLKDMLAVPQQYGAENCSCDVQSNCSKYPGIYVENPKKLFTETIPGFLVGCLPLNALLQSNLDCLFNETCLSIMRAFIFYVNPIPFEVLKYSSLAIPNTTIDTILNQLFVSDWLQNTSFDLYFNQCAPQLCQYSYLTEYNTVYVATTLIALFGGLTIGLRFFVHYTALIIHKITDSRKKKNQIVPNLHQSNITPISIRTKVQLLSVTTDEEENRSKHKDRVIIICIGLLSVTALVVTYIILLLYRKEQQNFTMFTTQTTQIITDSTITMSISIPEILLDSCHMTLKYQSHTYETGLHPIGRRFKSIDHYWNYLVDQNDIIAIVIGDFNNDGIESDMALCTHDRRLITILYNSSNSDHYSRPSQTLLTNEYPSKMTKGKFNDDEIDDIVIISFLSNTLQVQLSFGNGNFLTQIYLTDVYPTSISVINFNDDEIDDLAILHCNGAVSVFLGLKIGIFNRHYLSFQNYTTTNGKCAQSLRVIDLNQDGRDDVVFVDPEMNVIRLLLGSQCDE